MRRKWRIEDYGEQNECLKIRLRVGGCRGDEMEHPDLNADIELTARCVTLSNLSQQQGRIHGTRCA